MSSRSSAVIVRTARIAAEALQDERELIPSGDISLLSNHFSLLTTKVTPAAPAIGSHNNYP